jgi:hypothetical protein
MKTRKPPSNGKCLLESYQNSLARSRLAQEAMWQSRNRLLEAFGWRRYARAYGKPSYNRPELYVGQVCKASDLYWKNPNTGGYHHPNCGAYVTAVKQIEQSVYGARVSLRRAGALL